MTFALVDAQTKVELFGGHVDRPFGALFEMFDELVEALATALSSHLMLAEENRFRCAPPDKLDAWMLATRASQTYFRNPTTSLRESLAFAHRATTVDPNYGYAWAVVAFLTALKFAMGLSKDREKDVAESFSAADRALQLDARDPWNLLAKGVTLQYAGKPIESMDYLRRSLRMNPSDVFAHCYYGRGLMFSGKPVDALIHFERFRRLNPDDPGAHMAYMYFAIANMFLERWPETEAMARESLVQCGGRNGWSLVALMVALQAQGRTVDARAVKDELRRVVPHWSMAFVRGFFDDCQVDKTLLSGFDMYLMQAWGSPAFLTLHLLWTRKPAL